MSISSKPLVFEYILKNTSHERRPRLAGTPYTKAKFFKFEVALVYTQNHMVFEFELERATIPGNSLPSSHSKKAPPAVEM